MISKSSKKNNIIDLQEYLFQIDPESKNKYVFLKLINNYKEPLYALKAGIKQFDNLGNVIADEDFDIDGLNVNKHQEFVPYVRIQVKDQCCKIKFDLKGAKFKKFVFPSIEVKKAEKLIKDTFKSTNRKSRNRFRLILLSVALSMIAISSFVSYYFINDYLNNNLHIAYDGYEFDVNRKNATITKLPDDEELIIPTILANDFRVVGIEASAFDGLKAKKIVIESENISIPSYAFSESETLTSFEAQNLASIGDYAFNNAKNLVSVKINIVNSIGLNAFESCTNLEKVEINAKTISSYAFKDCSNITSFSSDIVEYISSYAFLNAIKLTTLNVPNATLGNRCLENTAIETLTFGNVDYNVMTFGTLFGIENENATVKNLEVNMPDIPSNFFQYLPNLNLVLSDSVYVNYGAFNHSKLAGYKIVNGMEILNNTLISISPALNEISIPSEITSINSQVFKNSQISSITINSSNINLNESLDSIKNYFSLYMSENTRIIGGIINNQNLGSVTMSANNINTFGKLFTQYQPSYVMIIGTSIHSGFFSDYMANGEIDITSSVRNIASNAFENANVKKLSIPALGDRLDTYGTFSLLEELSVINNNESSLPANFVRGFTELKKLSISSNITSMSLPLIGSNCTSLEEVITPFVGRSSDFTTSLSTFNSSYTNLKYLTITGYGTLGALGANNLKELSFNTLNVSSSTHVLDGSDNLVKLSYSGAQSLSNLFSVIPTSLIYVSIFNNGLLNTSNLLEGSNVKIFESHGISSYNDKAFTGAQSLEYAYFDDYINSFHSLGNLNELIYPNILKILSPTFLSGTYNNTIQVLNYINYNHIYNLKYEDKNYQYDSIFIYDLEVLMDKLNINSKSDLILQENGTTLSLPYFGSLPLTLKKQQEEVNVTIMNPNTVTLRLVDKTITTYKTLLPDEKYKLPKNVIDSTQIFAGWYTDSQFQNLLNKEEFFETNQTLYKRYLNKSDYQIAGTTRTYNFGNNSQFNFLATATGKIEMYLYGDDINKISVYQNGMNINLTQTKEEELVKISFMTSMYKTYQVYLYSDSSPTKTTVLASYTDSVLYHKFEASSGLGYTEVKAVIASNKIEIPYFEGFTFKGYYSKSNDLTSVCYFNEKGIQVTPCPENAKLYPIYE